MQKKYALEKELLSMILPKNLLDYFDVVNVISEIPDYPTGGYFHIYLDEKNILPEGYSRDTYESKGFTPTKKIQDFPIRGRAVYLLIRRRRWRSKVDGGEIRNDYSFLAEGSKISLEFSNFLKGTHRI